MDPFQFPQSTQNFSQEDEMEFAHLTAHLIEPYQSSTFMKLYANNSLEEWRLEDCEKIKRSSNKLFRGFGSHEIKEEMTQRKLFTDIEDFMKSETFKDFKIIVDDREFQVHKFLIAARSPTLAEILIENQKTENIKLVDISVEIFELILKYLYTDELPRDDGVNYIHLLAAAGRLKIKGLIEYAANKLCDEINEENSVEILNLSSKYGNDDLKLKAFDKISNSYPKIDLKVEWIENDEKLAKMIEAFKNREKIVRKADEELKNIVDLI